MDDRQRAAEVLRRLAAAAERGELEASRRLLDALAGAAVGLETR